jgi:HEAT repeat protein
MRSVLVLLAGLIPVLVGCKASSTSPPSKELQSLIVKLRNDEPFIKAKAALELSRYGAAAASAVPDLMDCLGHEDPNVRQNAALALGKIGSASKAAIPALARALNDPEWTVRRNAAGALGDIGDSKAMPILEKVKKDPNEMSSVKNAALDSIQKLRR